MTSERPPSDSDPVRDPGLDAAWNALSREEPPDALDARILAAAHRAVGAAPQRTEVREATRPERWWWPLAAAASIGAVAFGLLQVIGPQSADVPLAERAVVSDVPMQSLPSAPPAARPALEQARVAPPMPATAPEPAPSAPPALAQDAAAPREAMGKAAVGGVAPAPAAAAPATALRAEAQRKSTAPLPVDEWLARIRKLRAEGRTDELAREIAAFRAAYPGEEKRLQDELARPAVPP